MNQNPYIDTDKCRTCGLCCMSFRIPYLKRDIMNDTTGNMGSELVRFLTLPDADIVIEEYKDRFTVTFKQSCKYLLFMEGEGYICTIYDDKYRPKICDNYPHERGRCEYNESPITEFRDEFEMWERLKILSERGE